MSSVAFAADSVTPAGTVGGTTPAGTTMDATAPAPAAPGFASMLLPFALMFGVMYFLVWLPNKRRVKAHQDMLSHVKVGDEVLMNSGLIGFVDSFNEKILTLRVDRDVKIKCLKSQVAKVLDGTIPDSLPTT